VQRHKELSTSTKDIHTTTTLYTIERPYSLPGITYKLKVEIDGKLENLYLTVSLLDGKPYEVFLAGNIRDTSKIVAQYIDTTTRLASLSMRRGVPLLEIIQQLEKAPSTYLYSIPIKIASVLKEFLPKDQIPKCTECGGEVVFSEGCHKCTSCGLSRCE
jgi:ribonucleoside-diphosphate reductase alpha chain